MHKAAPQVIHVSHPGDVSAARQAAKALAVDIGFDLTATEEIGIAVSELSSNLVEHAGGGSITLMALAENGRAGIQVDSADSGPGITDIDQAMTDGFSTKSGLGYGLGAVNRLMNEFEIQSKPGEHTLITCRRWLRSTNSNSRRSPLEFGAASRAHPMMEVNGDTFVIKQWDESALATVIDGVGHGPLAFQAAQAARQYIETHFDQPLETIFQNVGHTCRATRGVVMAAARFDWAQSKLTFASVGNIEARVFGSPEPMNFIVRRGVIGYNAPKPVVTEHHWAHQNLLILHSDGVKTSWNLKDFPHLVGKSASAIAQGLLQVLDRGDDDATVVVVRGEVP